MYILTYSYDLEKPNDYLIVIEPPIEVSDYLQSGKICPPP